MKQLEEYYRGTVSQAGYDLFAVFARFEYAMKRGGFRREARPDAAWKALATALSEGFFEKMKSAPEVRIYFDAPPDYLVLDDPKGVKWSEKPVVPTSVEALFDAIKTARNNLFHGDKGHDRKRDTDLMVGALFILNSAFEAAESDPKFRDFIEAMGYGHF